MRADDAFAAVKGEGDAARLAVIKMVTTRGNFEQLATRYSSVEGDWFFLVLEPRNKSGPYVWASALSQNGYQDNVPLVLSRVGWLFYEGSPPRLPLSSGVPDFVELAQRIAAACKFPVAALASLACAKHSLEIIGAPFDILVHDVGQASFVTLRNESGRAVAHFDAGWPISYNLHTAARTPLISSVPAPVILSHWDWDHLHGFHVLPVLRDAIWIAPVQKLGPGASRVANLIAKRGALHSLSASVATAGAFTFGRCRGIRGNLNNTGLWVRVILKSGKSLLYVGDGNYDLIPEQYRNSADFLVATHHGAEFSGDVPQPNKRQGICVVSVGARNTYRHPSSAAISRHIAAGWQTHFTCQWDQSIRGSRQLGP